MIEVLFALVLCLAAMAAVLVPIGVLAPWWSRRLDRGDNRRAVVAVVRARLAELERERRDELLDEATYQQLALEQQRRLLAETAEAPPSGGAAGDKRGIGALAAAALVVPLLAGALYWHLGGWSEWSIQQLVERSGRELQAGKDNRATLEALAEALERRLARGADQDGRLRFMLAGIDTELGRYDRATEHYRLLQGQFPEDAGVAAQYAQALYLSNGRKLTDEVVALAEQALAREPGQTTALGLLGIGAFERGDYATALQHWRVLLRQLPPDSPSARLIQRGVAQAEQALGPEAKAAAAAGPRLQVAVSLAPELASAAGGGTLFVFARAVGGPPLPLAVAKLDAAGLPLEVTLDDSMAMAEGMNLSSAKEVEVVARISASGQVRSQPGDLEGSSGPLTLTQGVQQLALRIDRKL